MAIYRGSQRISRINGAGFPVERAFHGSTLIFAAHDTVKITIANSGAVPLSLYSGSNTGAPLATVDGTSLVSFSREGTFQIGYNAAGFYLAPLPETIGQSFSITLKNCRGEMVQTLTFSASEGGTFLTPRYGAAVITGFSE